MIAAGATAVESFGVRGGEVGRSGSINTTNQLTLTLIWQRSQRSRAFRVQTEAGTQRINMMMDTWCERERVLVLLCGCVLRNLWF